MQRCNFYNIVETIPLVVESGGEQYPGAELIITLPPTPEPVLIDEYLVAKMQSEYKTHFPKVETKKKKTISETANTEQKIA